MPVSPAVEAAFRGMEGWSGHHRGPLLEGTWPLRSWAPPPVASQAGRGGERSVEHGALRSQRDVTHSVIPGKGVPSPLLSLSSLICEGWVSFLPSGRCAAESQCTRCRKASSTGWAGKNGAVIPRPHSRPHSIPVSSSSWSPRCRMRAHALGVPGIPHLIRAWGLLSQEESPSPWYNRTPKL